MRAGLLIARSLGIRHVQKYRVLKNKHYIVKSIDENVQLNLKKLYAKDKSHQYLAKKQKIGQLLILGLLHIRCLKMLLLLQKNIYRQAIILKRLKYLMFVKI